MDKPACLNALPADVQAALEEWLEKFDDNTDKTPLGAGYQGSTWLFDYQGFKLVVKTIPASVFWSPLLAFTLRHEYRVYKKLHNLAGIPKCYGLLKGRFLVLQYIDGKTLREHEPQDRDYFYQKMFAIIEGLHRQGVAHVDLKRKDNILVVNGKEPYFIDFGVAMVESGRLRWLNNYLMHVAKRFDYNAWIKHKYLRQYHQVSAEDRQYMSRTLVERFAKFIKQAFKRIFNR